MLSGFIRNAIVASLLAVSAAGLFACGGGGGGGGTETPPPYTPVLDAPSGLTAVTVSSTQINLSWSDESGDETGFKIERKTSGGEYAEIAQAGANAETFSATGLAPDTTYFFRVRAYNDNGNSAYSNEASGSTATTHPAAPSDLTATAQSSSEIYLEWQDDSGNETGFRIERSTDETKWSTVTTTAADKESYADGTCASNTLYYYRVYAVNGKGDSISPSNTASATTKDTIPDPPTGLVAVTISASQIDLSWNDKSDNEDGFKIERKKSVGEYAQIAQVAAEDKAYSDKGLEHATTYYYRVRSYNTVGDSAYVNDSTTTTDVPPVAPTGLGLAPQNLEITLTWSDNSDNETGFRIYRSLNGTDFTNVHTVGAGVETWKDTGLSPYTAYYYYVEAYNGLGSSGSSSTENTTTTDVRPADPSALTATTQSSTQIQLAWTDGSNNETGFRVERSLNGVSFSTATTVGANVTSVVDGGLTPGTHYYYRVYAYNGVGDSVSPSNTADATTNSTPVRKLTVYLMTGGGRIYGTSNPAYVKVFSDNACTNEIASRTVTEYGFGNKVVFNDVGQSPVYLMAYHDANGNGSWDAGENRLFYNDRETAPATPIQIAEGGSRTVIMDELDDDYEGPLWPQPAIINVTAAYSGAGTVDDNHKIIVSCADELDGMWRNRDYYSETSINGSVVSISAWNRRFGDVWAYYDADGNGVLSDGDPYELYDDSGIDDNPEPLALGEGVVHNISMSFDDSRVMRTRSLVVTVNYTGSQGSVNSAHRIYVFADGITASGPSVEIADGDEREITSNGGTITINGIFTSQTRVCALFDRDGDGIDRGDPIAVYGGQEFGTGYTPVNIAPGGSGSVTINIGDTYGYPIDDYEEEEHPRWRIRDNSGDLEIQVLGVFPETGTHTIGQDGIYCVMFASPDVPYGMYAYGGTITVTSLDDGGNITGSFSLSDMADALGNVPELAGSVSGTFSVPNNGSGGGTFTASGTVDGYAIDDSVNGTNAYWRPHSLTANVTNSPLPDGSYDCEVMVLSVTDAGYKFSMESESRSLVLLGGSGSITLYKGEDEYQLVNGKWYGAIMYLDNGTHWNTPHGSYHSTLASFQYNGGWDYGSRNFSQWIQYVRNGAVQSGMIKLHGTITNCPLEGAQAARMNIIPEDFNRLEYASLYNSNTVSISGGSANCIFQGQGALYMNEHYRYVVYIDTDNNGFEIGDYYSVCEPAGTYDGSNPVTGLTFSSWSQYDDTGTAMSPVDIQGSIINLSNFSGNYALRFIINETYRGMYVWNNGYSIPLTSGSGSLAATMYNTLKTGVSYNYSMYYDENSNNMIDEGEYVAASVDDVFNGITPVTGIDFDSWVQKTFGAEVGTDIIIEGSINGITLDATTRNYLRLIYVSTDFNQWGYDGCGGNLWSPGGAIDVGSSPYAFEAPTSGYLIVGKPYYYIMYLDSNQNGQPDTGEMRCILTNGGAGYAYDGSGTVTGLSFSSWSVIP